MQTNHSIKRLYIPKQGKIYNFKEELLDFGFEWDSKKNYYYNRYEVSENIIEGVIWLCKKNNFSYEIKEEAYKNFEERVEGACSLVTLNDVTFAIKDRKSSKFLYLISLYTSVEGDMINVVDNKNGQHFSLRTKLPDYKNTILTVVTILNEKKDEISKHINDFKLNEFMDILSILMNEHTKRDQVFGNINKFKFYTIGKMQESCFLCNCIKGFFPETRFFLHKGKIKSSLTQNYIGQVQEQKVWKFLYYNRDRVGVEKKPTLHDLFVGARIPVKINEFDTHLPINHVDYNYGNLIVTVFDGNSSVKLNRNFTQDELWKLVVSNR